MQVFTIYDNKAEYHRVCFFPTVGAAMRAFADLVNDESTDIGKHPTDYELKHSGTVSEDDGSIEPIFPVKHVGTGVDFLRSKELIGEKPEKV